MKIDWFKLFTVQIKPAEGVWSIEAGPLLLILTLLVVTGIVLHYKQARDRVRVKKVKVNLPLGIGDMELETDSREREAAWKLYVELMSRITIQPLWEGEGHAREALQSIYSTYQSGRDILKAAGPGEHSGEYKLGEVGLRVMNERLRHFLSYWHPRLTAWEALPEPRPKWAADGEFRARLAELQERMEEYATALAQIAGVTHVPVYRGQPSSEVK